MDKSALQTAAVIATIVATAWVITGSVNDLRGGIKANSAGIEANAKSISELREDVRELRGLLVSHVSGHNHAPVIAESDSE